MPQQQPKLLQRESLNLNLLQFGSLQSFTVNHNPEFNTAADIVKIRKSTKSHVSTSLKSLENKGLIEKKQSESNKKHIEIFLTESAKSIIYEGIDTQKRFAHDVLKGFSDEEIATFKNIFEKICNNAEDCLNKKQHREC